MNVSADVGRRRGELIQPTSLTFSRCSLKSEAVAGEGRRREAMMGGAGAGRSPVKAVEAEETDAWKMLKEPQKRAENVFLTSQILLCVACGVQPRQETLVLGNLKTRDARRPPRTLQRHETLPYSSSGPISQRATLIAD